MKIITGLIRMGGKDDCLNTVRRQFSHNLKVKFLEKRKNKTIGYFIWQFDFEKRHSKSSHWQLLKITVHVDCRCIVTMLDTLHFLKTLFVLRVREGPLSAPRFLHYEHYLAGSR